MKDNALNIDIQASNTYLAISITVFLLNLFATWYYLDSLWLSLAISIGLSLWLLYFLPKFVQLTHPHSIVKILFFRERVIIQKNNHSTQQYTKFHLQYQSNFLVIICVGKHSVVIFKDALTTNSLSVINHYLNDQHIKDTLALPLPSLIHKHFNAHS